ncbi:hypothetical protein BH23PLA1_BH23PLA1_19200 [soil metagenome]
MPERYWLVHSNGSQQLIDPKQFDLARLAEQARRVGARLIVEGSANGTLKKGGPARRPSETEAGDESAVSRYEPPISAMGPLFRARLGRIHDCRTPFVLDINSRPTCRVLGGYYRKRYLVRVYTHDRETGRRPLEELFDTFMHEVAHHLEYTEPQSFNGLACGRVPGRMHSALFWTILGELKGRWAELQSHRPEGGSSVV